MVRVWKFLYPWHGFSFPWKSLMILGSGISPHSKEPKEPKLDEAKVTVDRTS